MPLFRGNDTKIDTKKITDADGDDYVSGQVEIEVLREDGVSSLIGISAMAHVAAGVWTKTFQSTEIDTIPAELHKALVRVTVNDPIDATFERLEDVDPRRS